MTMPYRSLASRRAASNSNPIMKAWRTTLDLARKDLRLTACACCIFAFALYLTTPTDGYFDLGNLKLPDLSGWKLGVGGGKTVRPGDVTISEGFVRIRLPPALYPSSESIGSGSSSVDDEMDEYLPGTLPHLSGSATGQYILPRHPILGLIEKAKIKREEMMEYKRKVIDLREAVEDYRAAFGMDPPEGFEAWFNHATLLNTTRIPSLIPLAHTSILPYLSLPPSLLHTRVPALQKDTGIFGMTLYPEGNGPVGGRWKEGEKEELGGLMGILNEDFMVGYMSPRHDYPDLLKSIIPLLPPSQQPENPVQLSVCVRDGACTLSAGPLLEKSRALAKEGKVWDKHALLKEEIKWAGNRGWPYTCDTPLKKWTPSSSPPSISSSTDKSFISDNDIAMDFCKYPDLMGQVGEMIMESEHVMRPLAPMLAVSRPMHGADMLGTPTRAVKDLAAAQEVDWESKSRRQVVWRGTATGVYHRDRWDWRSSQRHRLSRFAFNGTDDDMVPVLVERKGGESVMVELYSQAEMSKKWLDVGLVKEDIDLLCGPGPTGDSCRLDGSHAYPTCPERESQCDIMLHETAWVDHMSLKDSEPYRYRLDVDGYGWSSRWRKVLSTNSVVMKSTIYPEWWTAQAVPWYHYVPLNYDYSDLWDLMSFLDGAPDGSTEGRQDLAQEIAWQGKQFADEELSWEAMQSYMLLLLLEYRRAWSNDRAAATFKWADQDVMGVL